jgi:putative ABC transport system substrate-binding protein
MMRLAVALLSLAILAAPLPAGAQPAGNVPRVVTICPGFCPILSFDNTETGRAFLTGLREQGYVPGETVFIDERPRVSHEGLAAAALGLVRRNPSVILVQESVTAAKAVRDATGTIPIVVVAVPDALEAGLVKSLARPGGHITGITLPLGELVTKQVDLLRQIVPGLSRLAVLSNPANADHEPAAHAIRRAGQSLGVNIQVLTAKTVDDFDGVFVSAHRERAGAILVLPDGLF